MSDCDHAIAAVTDDLSMGAGRQGSGVAANRDPGYSMLRCGLPGAIAKVESTVEKEGMEP